MGRNRSVMCSNLEICEANRDVILREKILFAIIVLQWHDGNFTNPFIRQYQNNNH